MAIDWFWDEHFWLPTEVKWADLTDSESVEYPHIEDLILVLPFAVAILVFRFFFERFLARPLGVLLGVSTSRTIVAEPNTFLENVFARETKRPDGKRMLGLAKQLDIPAREVERWFRKRRCQTHKAKIDKFTESCSRFVYYSCLFTYGVTHIPKESWFWDLDLCWHEFPFHAVTPSMSNLYFFELSFYISLILSSCNDVKRKDFYPMFCHHIFTSLLLTFSWVCNFVRIGCIIIVLHDVSDVFLEYAKACNYAKWSMSAHVMFAGFASTFFFCRIVYLPFWVIHSSMFTSWQVVGPFPAYYFFNGLLVIMLGLNTYWWFYIVKMVFNLIFDAKVTEPQDIRSEDDESDSDMESAEELPEEEDLVGPNGDFLNSNHKIVHHHSEIANGTTLDH